MDAGALLHDYIDQIARFAFQEFNMFRVAQDQVDDLSTLDGDEPLAREKWRFRDVIREEINRFKNDLAAQVDVMIAAADHGETADEAVENHLDELLATDVYYQVLDDDHRPAFRDEMAAFFHRTYEGYEPLLTHPADDAWDAARDVYTADEAEAALTTPFRRTPILREYEDAIAFRLERDDVTILVDRLDYTDEMLRIMDHGEDYIRKVVAADVERAFS